MSGFGATIGRLSDRVNPIVVKELRQAVRSRIVTGIFIFFLVVKDDAASVRAEANPLIVAHSDGRVLLGSNCSQ